MSVTAEFSCELGRTVADGSYLRTAEVDIRTENIVLIPSRAVPDKRLELLSRGNDRIFLPDVIFTVNFEVILLFRNAISISDTRKARESVLCRTHFCIIAVGNNRIASRSPYRAVKVLGQSIAKLIGSKSRCLTAFIRADVLVVVAACKRTDVCSANAADFTVSADCACAVTAHEHAVAVSAHAADHSICAHCVCIVTVFDRAADMVNSANTAYIARSADLPCIIADRNSFARVRSAYTADA